MRRGCLVIGFALLALLWLGPLPRMSEQAFAAHMLLHMGVVALASPLISFGIAATRFDAARYAPELFSPIPVSVVELAVVWAWHAPALHHAARHSAAWFVAEQSMFLVSGILLWLSAFGGETHSASRRAQGVVGLLLTSMHMTLLGALLALAQRNLYGHAGVASSIDDQHLGGAIMLLIGGASYLAGGLWLTAELMRETIIESGEPT